MRKIPSTMATQHPDNASVPFWDERGNGFVSVYKELEEAMVCFRDLHAEEYMWDWEGKYAEEAVIDKLFSVYYEYFRKHPLGREKFLTFRLPNIWHEQGYSLIRALMVVLTSEDFAHDLSFVSRPLFEAILPMTERADQMLYIQKSFQQLARFKGRVFNHRENQNAEMLELIPLIEGVDHQQATKKLFSQYVDLYKKNFRTKPPYLRPFLARSDPALMSSSVANILANKIALSDLYEFSASSGIPVYPIIGAGSLVFRGGLSPDHVKDFLKEYQGVRTVTPQSGFRYDYPLPAVKKAIAYLNEHLPKAAPVNIPSRARKKLPILIGKFATVYRRTLSGLIADMHPIFKAVPKRRERRQHIGFLAYQRNVGQLKLPRAINFAAAFYSLGVPPELLGFGRGLARLSNDELELLRNYYVNMLSDIERVGRYLNRTNLERLAKTNAAWNDVIKDIALTEQILGVQIGPKNQGDLLYQNLTESLYLQRHDPEQIGRLIMETGILRKSLG